MKKIKKNSIKKKPAKKRRAKKLPIKKKPAKRRVGLILRVIKLQQYLKPEFNFKINFSLEKYIQAFFDSIANRISEYKTLKAEEKRRRQLEEIEKKEKEKLQIQKQKVKQEEEQTKLQEKALKEEIKLEKERARDIKLFLPLSMFNSK